MKKMKKKTSLVLLPLLAVVFSGCTSTKPKKKSTTSLSSTSTSTSISPQKPIEKTKLKYTYDDYQTHNFAGVDNCPLTGSPKLLIIPIWFSDSEDFIDPECKEAVREDIEVAYVGSNEETGWRSVRTFYQEESLGALNLQANVTEWYSISESSTTYANDHYLTKTTSLVDDAASWYFTNNPSDNRNNYDANGDGFMDGVCLIYAAPDYRSMGNDTNNLWAYCYWLGNDANVDSPSAKSFFWASYDFMYDYQEAAVRTQKTAYGAGDCSYCNIDAHTFIHEMGHVLGLEDYYDYCEDTALSAAGGFSMQDWAVGGHDPYSVMAYGWAEPYIPTETNTITLNDFQSSHDLILLANHDVDSPFDEYILVEFYTPTGLNKFDVDHAYSNLDKGPSVSAIRLWHIDARLIYCTHYSPWTGQQTFAKTLITNPDTNLTTYGIYHAMSNSYGGGSASFLGSSYYNYNVLQLLRNDTSVDYRPTGYMSNADLFQAGDSFTMKTFNSQFVKGEKMNDGQALGWTITVNEIGTNQASVTVTKD